MGRYAPRTRFCEVFLNTDDAVVSIGDLDAVNQSRPFNYDGDYVGVYLFTENIKRDKNRVDIAELSPQDNAEPEISGGYILKHDHKDTDVWFSNSFAVWLAYVYPRGIDVTPQQDSWIQSYVYDCAAALFGLNYKDPNDG